MFDLHERRKLRRYIFSHLTLVILLILVVAVAWGVWGVAGKEGETREKRDELVRQRDSLTVRGKELESEIESLRTKEGVEGELRQRFDVGAPGEKLVVIVDPELPESLPAMPERRNFWEWLRSWFE